MTLDALRSMISEAPWFECLAEPGVDGRFVQVATLAPWAGMPTGDEDLERIADQMTWLPSSREQDDPIHGRSLEERAERIGKRKEIARQTLDVDKATLRALGRFQGHPSLKVGPHDFTEAARGGALFAARRAACEILLGEPGFWCQLMQVYGEGRWPCGILPDGRVVVI